MATVMIDNRDTALYFARRTRVMDLYVMPRECATASVVHEFLCLQETDTIVEVNRIYKMYVKAGWFFIRDGMGNLAFNPVS